ncbi:MAG: NUDIX hydrolase [Steroidobacterales bacterium]
MSGQGRLTKPDICAVLEPAPIRRPDEWYWLTGASAELQERARAASPERLVAAAVLVPLVEREEGFAVLLTQRSAALKDHAGQISFPGGRIEAADTDPWEAALREAQEEIGLQREWISFAGYLPDHPLLTGYRVTPVVGFVAPQYRLALDAAEVHDAFEVPLDFLFDAANHRPRMRTLGGVTLETIEIPYAGRTIWGATAGMLLTLRRLVRESKACPA